MSTGGAAVATGGYDDWLFKFASTGGHWCPTGGHLWFAVECRYGKSMKKVWLAFHPVVIADWILFWREGEGSKMANKKIYEESVPVQNYALSALKKKKEIRIINFQRRWKNVG